MRISVRQLRRIIKESLITEVDSDFLYDYDTEEDIEAFLRRLDDPDPYSEYGHYNAGEKMLLRSAAEDRLEAFKAEKNDPKTAESANTTRNESYRRRRGVDRRYF